MLVLIFVLAAAAPAAPAAAAPLPTYRAVPATRPITIDGKLDDAAWAAAEWTSDFVALNAADERPPRTRAKFSWDEKNLYIAAELSETDVRAEMKSHDDPIYRENALEIFIDPDGDGENYLELQINALNTTFDLIMSRPYSQRGRPNSGFDVEALRTAVRVEGTLNEPSDADVAWTVELAIPWKSLEKISPDAGSLPPKAGTKWRVNLARTIVSRERGVPTRYATWSPIEGRSLHAPRSWGWVEFQGPAETTRR